MTDDAINFESIDIDLLKEQFSNQLHNCFEGDIELNDTTNLNEEGQYHLDISTSCLNNDINIKNSVSAKELLIKLEDNVSWINAKIYSDDNNLKLILQGKEELYIGNLDSNSFLYTKLLGNKIAFAGKVLSKALMLQTEYFKCTKDALLSTTNFTQIIIEEKGEIHCKIVNDKMGVILKKGVSAGFNKVLVGEEGFISSGKGPVKLNLGYNSELEIITRELHDQQDDQSLVMASGKEVKITAGRININEGSEIAIYDDEKSNTKESKGRIIFATHNMVISGEIRNNFGKIVIRLDGDEGYFTLGEKGIINGREIYIDYTKGKGSIEGNIKSNHSLSMAFSELNLGEERERESRLLSIGNIDIKVLNNNGEFNHYGVIGSKEGDVSIKAFANYYNDRNSLIIAQGLNLEVYQGRGLVINGQIYAEKKGYFGVQPHKDINFLPGSVVWLGNYEMSVNDYKIIKLKNGSEKLSTGTIRCYGCKFFRFGSGEEESQMDMFVFEITGVDIGTNLQKLALTDGNEKSLAKLENAITKNTVITAEWHDAGLTKLKAGLIKEGKDAILNFQGPTVLEIPTDIKYYLEGGGEKPQFYINAYGKLGSLMDGNDPFNFEKKFLEDGKEHLIKQSELGFEKRLMLAGSGIYDIDLIDVTRNEGLKDGWIWKKQDISCKEDCEFIIEGKNGINFKPIVYFSAKANKEIREYIKFPFDVCAFLENLGFNEIGEHLIIGDGQYLYKLVNDVAYKEIGLFIGGQEILLNILASNALWEFTKNPLLEVGKELSSEQKDKINKPIIWPIWKDNCIEGQRCMSFKLYGKEEELVHLDKNKANIVMLDSEVEVSGKIAINDNTKLILRDSKLIIGDYLFNKGLIETIGKVYIEAKNIYQLGKVSGKGEIGLAAREEFLMQLLVETVKEYYVEKRGFWFTDLEHYSIKSYAKTNPSIEHEGNVYIGAGGDVKVQGGDIKGKTISIEAGDKVVVIPAEFYELYKTSWSSGDDHGWETKERWINKLVDIVGKEGVRIVSKNDNILYAPQIKTEGDLEVGSVMGSNKIMSVIDRYSAISYEYEDGGFWSSDKTYYNSHYQEKAQEARLDTKGIKFLSAKDTVIQGGYIAANWVTMEVGEGKEGSIILLPSREVSIKISEVHKDGIFRELHHIKRDSLSTSKPTIIYVKEECIKEREQVKCSGGYFLGYAKNQYLQLASDVSANEIKIKAPQGIRLEASVDIEERYEYKKKKSFGISFKANSNEVSASIGARISKYEATTHKETAYVSSLEGKTIVLETEEILYTQGARITAEEKLIIKSKLEIHDVAYNRLSHSERNIKIEAGFKIGAQSSLGGMIDSGKRLDQSVRKGKGTVGAINTAFAAYEAYSNVVDILSGGGIFSGGAWFYASYQQSSDKINQREVVATVIRAGTYYGESEELRLKSTQIEAYNAYFVTDKLTIETESHTSHRESSSFGASVQIPVSGGTSPSFGANIAELEADESVPFTASIFIHNKLSIDVNGEASIKGASISAKSLEGYFRSLILESVQEIGSSDGFNFGISSGLKKESLLSGMSAEISYSNRNVVKQMTQLIGSESTKVVVMHALHLNGAVIANAEIGEDGKYTDLGNLELTAGELFIKHIYDADEGLTLGGGFSLGKKIIKDENNPYSNKYTATFGGKDGEGYTRGTIGKGKVVIGGEDVSKCKLGEDNDKCKDVNRDINSAQDFDYTYNIDTIKMVFIDPKEIAEKSKKVAENIDKGELFKGAIDSFKNAVSDIKAVFGGEKIIPIVDQTKTTKQPQDKKKQKPIIVTEGMTLSDYAVIYGTTVEALAELNNIKDPNLIYIKQKLEVPTDAKYPGGDSPNYQSKSPSPTGATDKAKNNGGTGGDTGENVGNNNPQEPSNICTADTCRTGTSDPKNIINQEAYQAQLNAIKSNDKLTSDQKNQIIASFNTYVNADDSTQKEILAKLKGHSDVNQEKSSFSFIADAQASAILIPHPGIIAVSALLIAIQLYKGESIKVDIGNSGASKFDLRKLITQIGFGPRTLILPDGQSVIIDDDNHRQLKQNNQIVKENGLEYIINPSVMVDETGKEYVISTPIPKKIPDLPGYSTDDNNKPTIETYPEADKQDKLPGFTPAEPLEGLKGSTIPEKNLDDYILLKEYPDTVDKVGGRYPSNGEYAGKKYPVEKLPEDLQNKYPNSVEFDEKGFPDFKPYTKKEVKVEGLIGDHNYDYDKANKIAGFKKIPEDYTWHHHQDGKTMQLVPRDLHRKVGHTGGASTIKHNHKVE